MIQSPNPLFPVQTRRQIRIIVLVLAILITHTAFSQQARKFNIDPNRQYEIANGGRGDLIQAFNLYDTIRAEIHLNGPDGKTVEYAKTSIAGDTLTITLFNYDLGQGNHELKLKIFSSLFLVGYIYFVAEAVPRNRVFEILSAKLILDSPAFKTGRILRGFVKLKARCIQSTAGSRGEDPAETERPG